MFRTILRSFFILFLALPLFAQAPHGSVTAWGDYVTTTPQAVAAPAGVSFERIEAGVFDTIAATTDGLAVYTWSGLGDGLTPATTPTQIVLPPLTFPGTLPCINSVAAGNGHFVIIASAYDVFAWGSNSHGQLGDGTLTSSSTPVRVIFPAPVQSITAVAAGYLHSLAITGDGVYAWGQNEQGQLGDGTTVNRSTPVKVLFPAAVTSVSAISAGFMDSFAITNDGLYAWGYNFFGELGDGTNVNRLTPVKVTFPRRPAFTTIYSVAAGEYHTLALTDAGVFAWGENISGQLGDGSLTDSPVPLPVKFPRSVISVSAVAAGTGHSLAVTNDGLYAWGANAAGQLGTAVAKKKFTPAKITGEDNAFMVGAGEHFSVALH